MQAGLDDSFRSSVVNPNIHEEITGENFSIRSLPVDKKKKGKKSQYPKFEIEHNSLVRTGWSKKEKREYSHKVSKSIYDLTVAAMEKLSKASAGPFMAENIIEKVNENGQQVIPAYQIYVVIGFLKDQGLIRQIGREGYNIPTDIQKQSQTLWK
jgi:hypothetical protein